MTQEAIKMGMTEEDISLVEKVYRENPRDQKARADYLEAGIREVRARLKRMYGAEACVAFAIRLLDEILPESDEEMGLPILTRDKEEER